MSASLAPLRAICTDFEPLCQDLNTGMPVNPGDSIATVFMCFREPGGQSVQIARKGAKLADIFLSAISGMATR